LEYNGENISKILKAKRLRVWISPLVAWAFGTRSMGTVFGMIVMAFSLGSASGYLLTGFLFDTFNSYVPAFIILAVIGTIGLGLTIVLKPVK
jgi:MFS family permease